MERQHNQGFVRRGRGTWEGFEKSETTSGSIREWSNLVFHFEKSGTKETRGINSQDAKNDNPAKKELNEHSRQVIKKMSTWEKRGKDNSWGGRVKYPV